MADRGDGPPPKKKTRIFARAGNKIGSIFKKNRKSEESNPVADVEKDSNLQSGPSQQNPYASSALPHPRGIDEKVIDSMGSSISNRPSAVAAHENDIEEPSIRARRRSSPRSDHPLGHHSQTQNAAAFKHEGTIALGHSDPMVTDKVETQDSPRTSLGRGAGDESLPNGESKDVSRSETPSPSMSPRSRVKTGRRQGIHGIEQLYQLSEGNHCAGDFGSLFRSDPNQQSTQSGSNTLSVTGGQLAFPPFTFRADQQLHPSPETPASVLPQPAVDIHTQVPRNRVRTTPALDIDRDATGRLVSAVARSRIMNIPGRGITNLPLHATRHPVPRPASDPEAETPENEYMSPNRIVRALEFSRANLKRKRGLPVLPPTPYIYQRTNDPNFNVFRGILLYPELCYALASHLPLSSLISLYAISRDFNTIITNRLTTVILSQALRKAPGSARQFPFRCYAHLCVPSQMPLVSQVPMDLASKAEKLRPRMTPSFRWLRMVLHREKVVHELVTVLAEDGIPLPMHCVTVIKKLWFLMDIPDNSRRIGYIHSKNLVSDKDLYFAMCFVVKLDMRLNDPAGSQKSDSLRKLLLGQPSMTIINQVLKREMWTTQYDLMKAWIQHRYDPPAHEHGLPVFGVPGAKCGRGKLEYWGLRTRSDLGREPGTLLRPDQLIIREVIRREMRLEKMYLRFLLYGYVNPTTLKDYRPQNRSRRIHALRDEEYEVDDVIGGVAALEVGDQGHDELLDLGAPRQASPWTCVRDGITDQEARLREKEEAFLEQSVKWFETEKQSEAEGKGEEMSF